MNNLKNKVSLIGRLGAAPEFTKFENGRQLAKFSLATNDNYKDKNGQWHERTDWHMINVWGKLAERMNNDLQKGTEVLIEGKIAYQNYETKTGEKKFLTVIEASDYLMIKEKPAKVN